MAEVIFSDTLVDGETALASDVMARLNEIVAQVNGGLDATNLADAAVTADQIAEAVAVLLGVSTTAGGVRRGKSIVATPESRTNTAYGLLTTPDRVPSVVLPSDGLLLVGYQATWQNSVAAAGRAAIFIGANQLKVMERGASDSPTVQEVTGEANANIDAALASYAGGLTSDSGGGGNVTGDVATGQVVGQTARYGLCTVFAAAGTYDVSVQFKASSGSVTVKNRKLWVMAIGF